MALIIQVPAKTPRWDKGGVQDLIELQGAQKSCENLFFWVPDSGAGPAAKAGRAGQCSPPQALA